MDKQEDKIKKNTSSTLLEQSFNDDEARLAILQKWAISRHIWINDDIIIGCMERNFHDENQNETGLQTTTARGKGYGVYVRKGSQPLTERQILVLVPKRIILSARTSSLNAFIDEDLLFGHDAAAGLLLSVVLLYEFLRGDSGPWWGYLQSMPRSKQSNDQTIAHWGINLPMHWKEEENENESWRWIENCESGRMVRRTSEDPTGILEGIGMSLARLQDYYRQVALPLLYKAHPFLTTKKKASTEQALWNDFVRMHSIISSRSFVVDMFHGVALVPISDMFNHSDDANVHFETDEDVCDECGELGMCPHNDDPLPSAAYGRPSAFLPAKDGPNSIDWKAPKSLEGLDTVDMVAQEQIDQKGEAFSTYGLMSNSILLTTYGFCLEEETEWERYGWEWRNHEEMVEICTAFNLKKASKKRHLEHNVDEKEQGTEFASTSYDLWVEACRSFTHLPLESFVEFRLPPMEVLRVRKNESKIGAASLTMPVTSPFFALVRSLSIEDVETKRELRPVMNEHELSPSLETFLSPLSMHEGSRDKYQPLFIDRIGRISLPLFRAAILSAFVNDNDCLESSAKLTFHAEGLLDHVIIASDTSNECDCSQWSMAVIRILERALRFIRALVHSRKVKLYISREDRQEEALRIIEVS